MISEKLQEKARANAAKTLPDTCTISRATYEETEYLSPKEVWTEVADVPCRIAPTGRQNFYTTGTRTEQYDYVISVAHSTDLGENDLVTVTQRDGRVLTSRVGLVERSTLNLLLRAYATEASDGS